MPQKPSKRRVRFQEIDDSLDPDEIGGGSCVLLVLLCIATVFLSVGGTALYCTFGDMESPVCTDFADNMDFYYSKLLQGMAELKHWIYLSQQQSRRTGMLAVRIKERNFLNGFYFRSCITCVPHTQRGTMDTRNSDFKWQPRGTLRIIHVMRQRAIRALWMEGVIFGGHAVLCSATQCNELP